MRHITTSLAHVEQFKKEAKRLQRARGGKRADALDRVARQHGYLHWHHVTVCFKETQARVHGDALIAECEAIAAAERQGLVKVILTGPESSASQPFVLFSTGVGDAWLLDPLGDDAACVVWQGQRQPPPARLHDDHLEIGWDGRYELLGAFFQVTTTHEAIGTRAIGGYPLDAVREVLERARTIEQRMHAIFDQPDALELTDELIAQLVRTGWDESALRSAAADGGRYSPGRNSVLSRPRGFDEDGEEFDER